MSQEMEIEYKNLLTKEEYDRLFEAFELTEEPKIVQENFYFDTPDFDLRNNRSALRIRKKADSAEVTLKTPKDNHLLETNEQIDLTEAEQFIKAGSLPLPESIKAQLLKEKVEVEEVALVTSLKTLRYEKQINDVLIVLDQSWYADTTDFELEIEATSESGGIEAMESILEKYHIKQRSTKNKIERAYEAAAKKQ